MPFAHAQAVSIPSTVGYELHQAARHTRWHLRILKKAVPAVAEIVGPLEALKISRCPSPDNSIAPVNGSSVLRAAGIIIGQLKEACPDKPGAPSEIGRRA